MTRTPYELAAPPTSHNAADPSELNVVCRSKTNLPNQTDSNAALLPYLTHQFGSAHEWSGVWNGPWDNIQSFEMHVHACAARVVMLIKSSHVSMYPYPQVHPNFIKSG